MTCTKAQLRIDTGSAPPSRLPLRRFSPAQEKYISEETQRLLKRDVIEPSTSPWSAQVVLASKKDGSYRYCVDFRRLNCVIVKEHYPVPRVEDMIDTLAGAKFFSTLDFESQLIMRLKFIPMTERKQHSLPSKGTGSGSEFHLGFAMQRHSLCVRLQVC